MNVFYIDSDPTIAAQSLVDKHVVKMILETAQLLSTAHRVIDGKLGQQSYMKNIYENQIDKNGKSKKVVVGQEPATRKHWYLPDDRENIFYRATHTNHPSAIWCRSSVENYNWLVDHLYALGNEYTHRYDKTHKTMSIFYELQSPPHKLEEWSWTTPPSCMDDQYKIGNNVIENYRNYYKLGKADLHSWKRRDPPKWIL